MSSILSNSITAAGSAAAARVASALSTSGAAPRTSAATGTTSGKAPSAAGGATITSNDFLVLLVSELKNQDPTTPTDPNAFVQQLVGVNSLQQLIQINQGVTAIKPVAASTSIPSA